MYEGLINVIPVGIYRYFVSDFGFSKVFEAFVRQIQSVNKRHLICLKATPNTRDISLQRGFRVQR